METIFVPSADAKEASLVHGVHIVPAGSLADLVLHLRGDNVIAPAEPPQVEITGDAEGYVDFSLIKGQEHVKRAMKVAAAGGHNA
jgi:magnesium chelatase family protein